jgi:hypothetical protein
MGLNRTVLQIPNGEMYLACSAYNVFSAFTCVDVERSQVASFSSLAEFAPRSAGRPSPSLTRADREALSGGIVIEGGIAGALSQCR